MFQLELCALSCVLHKGIRQQNKWDSPYMCDIMRFHNTMHVCWTDVVQNTAQGITSCQNWNLMIPHTLPESHLFFWLLPIDLYVNIDLCFHLILIASETKILITDTHSVDSDDTVDTMRVSDLLRVSVTTTVAWVGRYKCTRNLPEMSTSDRDRELILSVLISDY